jgi:hypothetical protein
MQHKELIDHPHTELLLLLLLLLLLTHAQVY